MKAMTNRAIFGSFDGLVCAIGVIISLLSTQHLIFVGGVGVGLAETVGMAAAEWQSDSENGLLPSLVIGATAGTGAIAPTVPYAIGTGPGAELTSIGMLALIVGAISFARIEKRGKKRAFVESFAIALAAAGVVLLGHVAVPGGAS